MEPSKKMREAARRGAKFMDGKRPGWARRVKITKLRMRQGVLVDGCGCVLAQEFGGFCEGARQLRTESKLALRGFIAGGRTFSRNEHLYRELDVAWADEIRARR